jgi:hypothetical protein
MKAFLHSITVLMLVTAFCTAEPSSNRMALARQLATFSQEEFYSDLATNLSNQQSRATAFLAIIQDETKILIPVVKEKMATLFAEEFSEAELRFLVKVHNHPAIKRFEALSPRFGDQVQKALDEHLKSHPEIQERMVERIMKQQEEAQHNPAPYPEQRKSAVQER